MELEIKLHDGPGRYGKLNGEETPFLLNGEEANIIKNQGASYDIQKEIAQWSVKITNQYAQEVIENNEKNSEDSIVVVQGSKYLDLRVKSIKELENMGYKSFLIANGDDLILHPRDLVDMIVNLRENINPNSSLMFSFAEASFMPILTYMGIDGFLTGSENYYSHLNVLMTPTKNYNLNQYKLLEIKRKELEIKNKNTLDFVVKEIKEHIKNGTLRNLVEERSMTSPQNTTALRLLDSNYQEYLQKYTQIY
jgi:predicted RNA-binding protein